MGRVSAKGAKRGQAAAPMEPPADALPVTSRAQAHLLTPPSIMPKLSMPVVGMGPLSSQLAAINAANARKATRYVASDSDSDEPREVSREPTEIKDGEPLPEKDRKKRAELPPRKYILLDSTHKPVMRPNSKHPVIFGYGPHGTGLGRLKYPRDGAKKAAKREDLYRKGSKTCTIFIREVGSQCNRKERSPLEVARHPTQVFVYEGWRERIPAPDVPKFKGYEFIWQPHVKFLRTEKLKYGKFAVAQ